MARVVRGFSQMLRGSVGGWLGIGIGEGVLVEKALVAAVRQASAPLHWE